MTAEEAIDALLKSKKAVVYAKAIAPIVEMHPGEIIRQAKAGEWRGGNYIISGQSVKFFRLDFLRKAGIIQ